MSPFLQDQSSKLEAQLSSATERLSSSQSDIAQLRQQVASAERRAEDKEASSLQTQEKFSAIFDSLRADHEKVGGCGRRVGRGVAVMNSVDAHPQSKASLEERYCVLSEQLMSTKEALARSEVEANGHQMECERLRQELSSMKEAHSELEETLQATEEAYHEVERERKDMETLAKETEEKVRSLKTPELLCKTTCCELPTIPAVGWSSLRLLFWRLRWWRLVNGHRPNNSRWPAFSSPFPTPRRTLRVFRGRRVP